MRRTAFILPILLLTAVIKAPAQNSLSDTLVLREVVVTATVEKGVTAVSSIGKDAIGHIQPSSVADLMELLPGGRAVDPVLSAPQTVNLRSAAGLSADYMTSALGTRIMIDGRPVLNDANLQSSPGYSTLGSGFVNSGADLRTIATEDIDKMEVVRGIASVEFGDLTSGLLKITRKRGGKDLSARFKADMQSRLFYIGKDFEWGEKDRLTLNTGISLLDSQADPRNPRQNYRRLTASLRMGKTWTGNYLVNFHSSLDFTGSYDDQKSDENLDFGSLGPVETYKSSYRKLDWGGDFSISSRNEASVFRRFSTTASVSFERDLIDRWKYNISGADTPYSVSLVPGESDALIIPSRYESTMQVDGRPLYVYVSSAATFIAGIHHLKTGIQWTMDKNFGEGTIFDPSRPFSTSIATRPRPYSAIPANHQLSAFAEETGESISSGGWRFEWSAGVRVSALAGAGNAYTINWKPYVDPRVNLRAELPARYFHGNYMSIGVYAGAGLHTKFPTMAMLYPAPLYGDIQQMSYWPVEKELRRVNVLVYIVDPSPYELEAARNHKAEIGMDMDWNGYSFSADVFVEDMTSGFRSGSQFGRYVYKKYDISSIDKSSLTGPPSTEGLTYILDTLLRAHGVVSNGSETLKTGIEFTFSTPRIKAINTRISANGAWFITKNANSLPEYMVPSSVVNGERYPYAGYYETNDGSTYESLSTNVILDTQVPALGLILTSSFQTSWYTNHHPVLRDNYPIAYLDKNLQMHPFLPEDAEDALLRYLVRNYDKTDYSYLVPFATHVNIKATKKFYRDKMSVSLFVNRLFSIAPDYTLNNSYIRRSFNPYFGMELNFKI